MKCNADQVIRGFMNYADSEIITKLPTMAKWVVGAGIGIASDKVGNIVLNLQQIPMLKTVGIIDENGNIDIDMLAKYMKESASKYGKANINVPLIGNMTFSAEDVDTLKNYIMRA